MIWAQYSENQHAVDEWEINWQNYRVEKHGSFSEITIHPENVKSGRNLPVNCEDCIRTSGVSVSIRKVFDAEMISFRVNDPGEVLPSPFPAFGSWTKFQEDEIFEEAQD